MPATPTINPPYINNRYFNDKNGNYTRTGYGLAKKLIVRELTTPKTIEILTPNHINIPASIRDKIKKSEQLLSLKYNWDDEGAQPISGIAFRKATSFLEKYSERILDVYGKDLITPIISPVNDGSIDLEWNLNKSYLLINFTDKDDFAIYYLALKNGEDILFDANGQINTKEINDKFTADLVGLS